MARSSTIMDKSLGTLLRFGTFSSSHRSNPSLHPTNNVGRVYPEFFPNFNFVQGGGMENCKKISERMRCFKRKPRNDRKNILQYCPKDFCSRLLIQPRESNLRLGSILAAEETRGRRQKTSVSRGCYLTLRTSNEMHAKNSPNFQYMIIIKKKLKKQYLHEFPPALTLISFRQSYLQRNRTNKIDFNLPFIYRPELLYPLEKTCVSETSVRVSGRNQKVRRWLNVLLKHSPGIERRSIRKQLFCETASLF